MKTIKFLPIFIGLLLSFAACGDEEKEEVNNDPLYQYEVQDLPAVVVEQSHLDGYWIEVSSKEYVYTGKFQYVGDRVFYERMYETSTTYDIDDFSHSGDNNAWCAYVIMPEEHCDYLAQYRMCYLFKEDSPSLRLRGNWFYLNDGIIHVHIIKEDDGEEINIDYKIVSYKGTEMTLRQKSDKMVVEKVFKKFDISRVNEVLNNEKENL